MTVLHRNSRYCTLAPTVGKLWNYCCLLLPVCPIKGSLLLFLFLLLDVLLLATDRFVRPPTLPQVPHGGSNSKEMLLEEKLVFSFWAHSTVPENDNHLGHC
jgi:hypothetical protein